MSYYDLFSRVYDLAIERTYRPYRKQIADALRLSADSRVLDVACGTGQNFAQLVANLGPEGRVVGVDFSAGMLEVAHRRVYRHGYRQIELLRGDVQQLEAADLTPLLGDKRPDRALCTLGLTVIPDWEAAVDRVLRLLEPGGRMVIFDIYAETRVPQTYVAQLFARANVSRKTWLPLERQSVNFQRTVLPGSPHVHGGRPFIASGDKPQV